MFSGFQSRPAETHFAQRNAKSAILFERPFDFVMCLVVRRQVLDDAIESLPFKRLPTSRERLATHDVSSTLVSTSEQHTDPAFVAPAKARDQMPHACQGTTLAENGETELEYYNQAQRTARIQRCFRLPFLGLLDR